ncbi:MAG: ferrochelatase, partial [Syntrophales bacterium]|nr:ferrochelatase [Syntrophales bacterium]
MKTGIIMVTLGGPRRLEEIPAFIKHFVGRELPAPAMKAVIERYRLIGGFSPLTRITEEQAQKLNEMLGDAYLCLPAFRYCRPFIEDAIESMAELGAARILFLLLSPFYASVTTGNYINIAKTYLEKISLPMPASFMHSWHREPLFIDSWVEKIINESFDEQAFYLFSAHSLPLKFSGEPYRQQIEETVEIVASRAVIKNHGLGWQSFPNNAPEPWITPAVEEKIDAIASAGFRSVIQVPIGFTADHIETFYDIDITHRLYALEKGISFRRISS